MRAERRAVIDVGWRMNRTRTLEKAVKRVRSGPQALPAHLEGAYHTQWQRYRKALKRCRRKFSEDSVHKLRVETRRLLALLDLVHTLWWEEPLAQLQRRLKRLFKSFSQLRDTQVQLLFVQEVLDRFPELARFDRTLAQRKRQLTARVARRVEGFDLNKLSRLATRVEKTLAARRRDHVHHDSDWILLRQSVDQAFVRAVRLRSNVDPNDSSTIHRVRVAFKKYRYLVELLQPLLPGVTARTIEAMHDYQTLMGEIQDIEILQATFDKFAAKKKSRAAKLLGFRGYLATRREAVLARYLSRAGRLNKLAPPAAPAPADGAQPVLQSGDARMAPARSRG